MSTQTGSTAAKPPAKPWWRRINEDWWSVIVGLALIGLVAVGILPVVPW